MKQETNRNNQEDQQNKKEDHKKKTSALTAAALGRSATQQVDPHSNSGLANTGTNISYEGPTAPGAGGSVGSGYASGKEAADETISTNSDYTQNRAGRNTNTENTNNEDLNTEDLDEELDEDELSDDDLEEDEMR